MSELKFDFGLRVWREDNVRFVVKARLMEKSKKLVILEMVDSQ